MLPLWVADMDFQVSSYIQEALSGSVAHGIFGYSEADGSFVEAGAGWMSRHYGWNVEETWLVKTPGIVFALAQAVRAFTEPGDAVLLQQPVYYPFSQVIRDNGRKIVDNTLVQGEDGRYRIDFTDFEEKIQVVHKKDLKNQADYARIATLYAGLVLRTRQPGDVYRPAGRSVHNRLRKWMNEAGIPAQMRDQLPLLAAGSEVLWVCGAGFAEGLAPDEDTAQVLQMEMEHREELS